MRRRVGASTATIFRPSTGLGRAELANRGRGVGISGTSVEGALVRRTPDPEACSTARTLPMDTSPFRRVRSHRSCIPDHLRHHGLQPAPYCFHWQPFAYGHETPPLFDRNRCQCLFLVRASRRRGAGQFIVCRQNALAILLRPGRRSHPRSAAAEGHAGRRRHHRRHRGRDRPAGVRESRHPAHSCTLLFCSTGGRPRHS